MEFQWNPWSGSSLHCIQVELEFGNVGFCGGRKTGVPGEKPSVQGREPTTNSTHICHRVRETNPGHIGGRLRGRRMLNHCAITAPASYVMYMTMRRN